MAESVRSDSLKDLSADFFDQAHLFRLLIARVRDYAIFLLDPEGHVVSWNAGAEAMKGYQAVEIVGRSFSCFYTEEDQGTAKPAHLLAQASAQGKVDDEGWRVRKDGSRFWADVLITALYDDGGTLRGYAKVTRDLTDRKRAEEALRAAQHELETRVEERTQELTAALVELKRKEEQLQLIADAVPALISYIDADLRYQFNNAEYERWFGHSPGELYGKPIREVLGDVAYERLRPYVEGVLAGHEQTFEMWTPYRDAGERYIQARYVPDIVNNQVQGFFVLVLDFSEQKRTEQNLRESEERLRAALGASRTGTFRWDVNTNELGWDRALAALFGLAAGQNVRLLDDFLRLVHPDDQQAVVEACDRCRQSGVDFEMEFRVVWPDGSVHWLYDRGRTFLDAQGRPSYMTGACLEVTAHKQSEEALRESEERLKKTVADLEASQTHLQGKIVELETFHDLVVGRELRMIELEREVARLRAENERLKAGGNQARPSPAHT